MKKVLKFILALTLCTVTLAGCGKKADSAPASAENSGKALSGKHLKVAMSANYKYFETVTVDSKGKEVYEGLDIDILNKMSEDLGFTYEIMNMPFSSLIGSLQAKQADFVISGMSYTEERAKSIDFSDKYATGKVGVLIKKGSDIDSVADLNGKKVACSTGTNYEDIIKKIKGAQLVTFDGQAAVTQELAMGRVDAAITGGTGAKKISSENEGLSFFVINSKEVELGSLDTFNIGFPKGSELVPIFNKEIKKLKEDGTLKQIITKWLGEDYVD
ncbi:transporter substrate-binding domain-containing protein [Clostridium sp. HMP27]|uniref:substrate-binding periplasmic protein n=1 Tax=Clostridium sp. HMP27 TaxID=1487921 RepID=UPI00052D85A5|nr:transporter substrate-binding domain-containing protein [Clostridium sp. HMP27]KGK86321.1 hypothetical protein DP68_14025 [Clostridium sp. HMP27]